MKKVYKILPLIIFFLLAFTSPLNLPAGGWTQQFMPYPAGGQIRDLHFVDSLLGFAVSDSSILKTTNGGDNWSVKHSGYYLFQRIKFLNQNTGFACAGNNQLLKTTNSGENWTSTVLPDIFPYDMSVLNEDTIWLVTTNALTGGVFRTISGGASWERQFNGGTQNPNKIYMYNARIGFMSNNSALPNIYKTTNSGDNWDIVVNGEYFTDMYFIDSLKGWKCMPSFDTDSSVKKTTNGGTNWIKQRLPQGGMINLSQIYKFSVLNQDTLWGSGGSVNYGSGGYRGILFRTTNGGDNWLFQIPDTSIHLVIYGPIQFINNRIGWAYESQRGIHTITGGNDTFYTGIQQISSEVPKQFKLYQNYPNPFNPRTVIKYQIVNSKEQIENVKLIVYDIQGREVVTLVNQEQSYGIYEVDFSGNNYSSGVYFFQLIITKRKGGEIYRNTKKMILIK